MSKVSASASLVLHCTKLHHVNTGAKVVTRQCACGIAIITAVSAELSCWSAETHLQHYTPTSNCKRVRNVSIFFHKNLAAVCLLLSVKSRASGGVGGNTLSFLPLSCWCVIIRQWGRKTVKSHLKERSVLGLSECIGQRKISMLKNTREQTHERQNTCIRMWTHRTASIHAGLLDMFFYLTLWRKC